MSAPVVAVARGQETTSGHTPQWSPRALLGLLHAAREELRATEEAMVYGVVAAQVVCRARAVPPSDPQAERRVLGAMANGRATLRDLVGLEVADFLASGHAPLFAALLTALRKEQRLGVRARPSARRRGAEAAQYEAATVRRRAVGNALLHDGHVEAWAALEALPRPGACPRRDIVRVEELGRWRRGER